jgi:hypothetical protein
MRSGLGRFPVAIQAPKASSRNDKGSDAKGGKKGAKKGKGKGGDAQSNKGGRGSGTQKRARDHGSRQDSGGQNGPECKSSECTNKVKWNHAKFAVRVVLLNTTGTSLSG